MLAAPTKDKTPLFELAMFSQLRTKKYRTKTVVFTTFLQQLAKPAMINHRYLRHACQRCCILLFWFWSFQNIAVYSFEKHNTCIKNLHFPWQQAKTSKNIKHMDIYSVSETWFLPVILEWQFWPQNATVFAMLFAHASVCTEKHEHQNQEIIVNH